MLSLLAENIVIMANGVTLDTWSIILRICAAVVLGGLIGLEREWHGRPAGLRTHILVAVGSCLVMLVSMYGFTNMGMTTDPARLSAQVVSGIGFLGAGAIIRDKGGVTGITTASTIWLVGMIGLACGNGYYIGALAATIISLVTLVMLRVIERAISHHITSFEVIGNAEHPLLKEIVEICDQYNLLLTNIDAKVIEYGKIEAIKLTADFIRNSDKDKVRACLAQIEAELKPYSITIDKTK